MSETTAHFWTLTEPAPRPRRARHPGRDRVWLGLAAGSLLGAFLAMLALLAAGPITEALGPADEPLLTARPVPGYALDREWRGYRTPVDVDSMFMKRR